MNREIIMGSMSRRKKIVFAVILAVAVTMATACSSSLLTVKTGGHSSGADSAATEIELWTYPIGNFSKPEVVNKFIKDFMARNPDIRVTVQYLDYDTGDDQVSAALEAGTAPDVIMEGPERLVSNWGASGKMADLGDLWTDKAKNDIRNCNNIVPQACRGTDGKYYEYPLCMTAHCMAINYDVFKKAGALKYLDLKNRTWTTQGFIKACRAVAASGLVQTPGIVYCGGQGGDQGTRALVTNLYGASFTNKEHTAYTIDSSRGIKALKVLVGMTHNGSLSYDSQMQAGDELRMFESGKSAMTFAWNASNEKNYAADADFKAYAMTFPTDREHTELCGGLWGFGIFNNGSDDRIAASKKLIRFLCDDSSQAVKSVRASGFFPVKSSLGDVYRGTKMQKEMSVYRKMNSYVADYYNITPGWTAQRTAWWNMLQQVFSGTDPKEAAGQYVDVCSRAIERQGK